MPDIARRRRFWRKYQGRIDPSRLVFVDDTWAKTNMAPLRGWCPRGQRLAAKVPYGHSKTMTFIAALRCDAITAPCVFDQPINPRGDLARDRRTPEPLLASRMPTIPGEFWVRVILKSSCSRNPS